MLRNEAVKLCQENNFNTGFFEGSDNNICVDAYELKVMGNSTSRPLQSYYLLFEITLHSY